MLDTLDLDAIFRRALANGGDFADLYYEEGSFTSVVAEDGRIERVLTGTDRGIGLRVVANLRTAYAYTNDLSQSALLALAETVSRAVQIGHQAIIAPRQKVLSTGYPVVIQPLGVSLEDKVALVRRADQHARSLDPRIKQVMAVYRDASGFNQLAASSGEFRESRRTGTLFLVQAVASDGTVIQTGYEPVGEFRGFELFDTYSPESIAEKAGRRALLMLSARKAPGGMMPVVLSSEAGGTMVHEAIGHGLEADLAQTGMSVYAGKIGQQVANKLITVIDDATIPHARGSFAFDDEGTPGQKTVLVENGILKGYLHDRISALKSGAAPTGNGRRESYQAKPIVRMSNTLISPGASNPADIIRAVPNGLFVRKMGGGQVNTVTGDFVFEVSEGYLIENGVVGEPVRGATLTGNGPEILQKISQVGTDLGFGIGTCGKDGQGVPVADAQPTLLIDEMTVGGGGQEKE